MKIRIKGDSVRFRLTMSEVQQLGLIGEVTRTTEFNENIFTYRLMASDEVSELSASFEDNTITMWLPSQDSKGWDESARVGFENDMQLDNGNTLHLLLEKDFVCLDETTEDQSDNYPNPKADLLNG